jgi:3-isopropylmalate/(R)-2-methylmalate dehydratase small subunit
MKPFTSIQSHAVLLPLNNIDTDQIIPARFLKTTGKEALGQALFADWRYAPDGTPRQDFILNQPESNGAKILVVGRNFGCGSSREHAPWSLLDFGFRAVLAFSFADIFRANAIKNGLLPVELSPEFLNQLMQFIGRTPGTRLTVDLVEQSVSMSGGPSGSFAIEPFARKCLLEGIDQLDYLLSLEGKIATFEGSHDRSLAHNVPWHDG